MATEKKSATKLKAVKADSAQFEQLVEAVEKTMVVNPAIYEEKEVTLLRCDTGYWVKNVGEENFRKTGEKQWLTITKGQAVVARVNYIQKHGLEAEVL